jgi:hypothetical protein
MVNYFSERSHLKLVKRSIDSMKGSARGWARIIHHLRDYVGSHKRGDHRRSTQAHTNEAAHEQFGFFNPARQTSKTNLLG